MSDLVEEFIKQVNSLLRTDPQAIRKAQRYNIPEYDHTRHEYIMGRMEEYDIVNPTPQQALNLHVTSRGNTPKPRRRKK